MYEKREDIPYRLVEELKFLNEVYPEIYLELVLVQGHFDPETVHNLSKRFRVPLNYMFMGHPGEDFPYSLEEFGGVRLII